MDVPAADNQLYIIIPQRGDAWSAGSTPKNTTDHTALAGHSPAASLTSRDRTTRPAADGITQLRGGGEATVRKEVPPSCGGWEPLAPEHHSSDMLMMR